MNNIMDGLFNGMAASEFYRAQVFPELYPHEKPMLIQNWSDQDREMYCGVNHTQLTASRNATLSYTINGGREHG